MNSCNTFKSYAVVANITYVNGIYLISNQGSDFMHPETFLEKYLGRYFLDPDSHSYETPVSWQFVP